MANVVLSKLYKYTPLQNSYGVNNIALVKGRPELLNLKQQIELFIEFRLEVIVRRTQFDLDKAEARAHILEGLLIALDNLDEVIALIRASKTVQLASQALQDTFSLSEIQAKAILEMRLQKLTGLERDKVKDEYDGLQILIADYKDILASVERQRGIVKEELADIKERFGDERRTDITYGDDGDINIEDMIANEDVIITISNLGYVKRTKATEYKTQGRGGRGSKGSKTRNADFIEHMFTATTHNYLLLFTELGRVHWLRVYEIPEANKTSSGRVIQNIINLPKEDKVRAYIKIEDLKDKEFLDSHFIVLCTRNGVIKKTSVESFSRPRTNGINAITIRDNDELLEARLTNGKHDILIGNSNGKAIRFPEGKIRAMGRSAAGVKGITLGEGDKCIGMVSLDPEDTSKTILVVSEKGNGKKSNVDEYRITNRGGKGVTSMKVTDKTGALVALKVVDEGDDLLITATSGVVIRMSTDDLRIMGRATQGVRVMRLDEGDNIADVTVLQPNDEDENETEAVEEEEGTEEGAKNLAAEEGTGEEE
jgi:DNA gyrase subunit A